MAQNADYSFQPEIVLIIPFSWGTAVSLGLIDSQLIPFVDAAAVLLTAGNIEFTLGRIVSLVTLFIVFAVREVGFRATSFIDAWIVYATVGLILAPPLFPAFSETIAATPAAFLAFTMQGVGFGIISYLN